MKPGNSYLNVCLLKVVVLLSNHESHVTKTFSFFSFFFWIFFYLLTPSSYIVFLVYFMPFIYIYQEMTYIEVTSCSYIVNTAQKMKFPINDFFSFMRIWSHLLNKSLMENFIFCVVKCKFSKWSVIIFSFISKSHIRRSGTLWRTYRKIPSLFHRVIYWKKMVEKLLFQIWNTFCL